AALADPLPVRKGAPVDVRHAALAAPPLGRGAAARARGLPGLAAPESAADRGLRRLGRRAGVPGREPLDVVIGQLVQEARAQGVAGLTVQHATLRQRYVKALARAGDGQD